MRGISKKMFISILTSVIVFVTMVATTFAWVGIFTYANTDKISFNLKVTELDSYYYLTISDTGEKGTFSDEIPAIKAERQIVNNTYNNKYRDATDSVIHSIYSSSPLSNISALVKDDNTLDFYELNLGNSYYPSFNDISSGYLKFDLYLSVDTKEGISSETTGIKANVMLNNIKNCLEGTKMYYRLVNHNQFSELPSSSAYSILKDLPDSKIFYINSKNAVRFSLSIYDPINIDDTYNDELPVKTIIYQGGSQMPKYDSNEDIFDLGGILENDYNTASKELLSIRPNYNYITYYERLNDTILNRNDLELIEDNSVIWDRYVQEKYLGCVDGIQTKMKISVHLWFEGWDADCIKAIEEQPISLNLSFTSKYEEI